ncbi:tyrosine-type recombinase/integrase [Verrucomicrobiota bacterium]
MSRHRRGYLYKRGKYYQLEYFINRERFKQSLKVTTKSEAEKERDKIMKPLEVADEKEAIAAIETRLKSKDNDLRHLHKQKEKKENPPIKIDDAWDAYLKSEDRPRDAGSVTLSHYHSQCKCFIKWLKSKHKNIKLVKDVTPRIAKKFMVFIEEKYTARTWNAYQTFFYHMFGILASSEGLANNPWPKRRLKRLSGKQTSRRELNVQEIRDIIKPTKGEFRLLFALGIFTGFRLGDCATLKWNEIDLERGIIRRIPRKTANTSGKMVRIGIPRELFSILSNIPPEMRSEYVLPNIAADFKNAPVSITKRIQQHFVKCGIETKVRKKGQRATTIVGFHSLRYSFISMQAEAGTPQAAIQDLAGHSNVAMTEHYEKLSDGALKQYADNMPDVIGETTKESWLIDEKND